MARLALVLAFVVGAAACGSVQSNPDAGGGTPDGGGGQPDGGGGAPDAAAPGFSVATAAGPATIVPRGGNAQVPFTIVRDPGFTATVTVTLSPLPPSLGASQVQVTAGQSGGVIEVTHLTDASAGQIVATNVIGSASGMEESAPAQLLVAGLPGRLDTSFGTQGKALTPPGVSVHRTFGAAVTASGDVLVVGRGSWGAWIRS